MSKPNYGVTERAWVGSCQLGPIDQYVMHSDTALDMRVFVAARAVLLHTDK